MTQALRLGVEVGGVLPLQPLIKNSSSKQDSVHFLQTCLEAKLILPGRLLLKVSALPAVTWRPAKLDLARARHDFLGSENRETKKTHAGRQQPALGTRPVILFTPGW